MDNIYVAKLGRAVGLKGAIKIYIDSDFPEQFCKNATFKTQKKQSLTIESINLKNSTVKFVGIDSVEEVKKLTNKLLYTSAEATKQNCTLQKDQYFWFDLIGCFIIEDGEVLGEVIDIQRLPLDDYFMINTTKELQNQNFSKQFLLPYTKEYITSVDIKNKKIVTNNAKAILEAS